MKSSRFLWTGLALVCATLLLWFLLSRLQNVVRKKQDEATSALAVIGPVADFSLTNQNLQPVSLTTLKGRVWIADIIFTRCPGPCLKMSRQMRELQETLPANSSAKLVTLTTDPDYDTPAILKMYAERFGADTNRWMFLTGAKVDLKRLETDSLKQAAMAKPPAERAEANDLFIHSTLFVVVDGQARFRGFFETTGEQVDFQRVKPEILKAVAALEHER